ncbi:hypothetical protein J6590_043070 [Homalodisca vitripennis]|nr:hypothetical protein J6590_043070 [Homalodisca vitripennis]
MLNFDDISRRCFTRHGEHLFWWGKQMARMIVEAMRLWDLNMDVMDSNHPSTKRVLDMLMSFGLELLELLVKTPMRVMATTQSAIDNIIKNIQMSQCRWSTQQSQTTMAKKNFNDCLNFYLNICCPTKTVNFVQRANNTSVTKGIVVLREKLNFSQK